MSVRSNTPLLERWLSEAVPSRNITSREAGITSYHGSDFIPLAASISIKIVAKWGTRKRCDMATHSTLVERYMVYCTETNLRPTSLT